MKQDLLKPEYIPSAILAIGIALAGYFISSSIHHFSDKDRAVTVKGLSTRDVKADYVVWPLSYNIQGNDLPTMYRQLADLGETLRAFLIQKGFEASDFAQGNITVDDNWDNYYSTRRPEYHYTLSTRLIISTPKVDLVVDNNGCQSELLERGIIVNSSEWNLDYQYNGLPELKPLMIEEATKNARAVAQKFADDANCRLGTIHRASQGQFSIEDDQYQPWIKHVRVVTTVDYMLK